MSKEICETIGLISQGLEDPPSSFDLEDTYIKEKGDLNNASLSELQIFSRGLIKRFFTSFDKKTLSDITRKYEIKTNLKEIDTSQFMVKDDDIIQHELNLIITSLYKSLGEVGKLKDEGLHYVNLFRNSKAYALSLSKSIKVFLIANSKELAEETSTAKKDLIAKQSVEDLANLIDYLNSLISRISNIVDNIVSPKVYLLLRVESTLRTLVSNKNTGFNGNLPPNNTEAPFGDSVDVQDITKEGMFDPNVRNSPDITKEGMFDPNVRNSPF